ncbi:MAG TPA: hypothetical protein VFA10_13650 [Ktedonobacteraceae bacterium]|nr:hypothetical protein [Ktedonobacteraceae bacterium]
MIDQRGVALLSERVLLVALSQTRGASSRNSIEFSIENSIMQEFEDVRGKSAFVESKQSSPDWHKRLFLAKNNPPLLMIPRRQRFMLLLDDHLAGYDAKILSPSRLSMSL